MPPEHSTSMRRFARRDTAASRQRIQPDAMLEAEAALRTLQAYFVTPAASPLRGATRRHHVVQLSAKRAECASAAKRTPGAAVICANFTREARPYSHTTRRSVKRESTRKQRRGTLRNARLHRRHVLLYPGCSSERSSVPAAPKRVVCRRFYRAAPLRQIPVRLQCRQPEVPQQTTSNC